MDIGRLNQARIQAGRDKSDALLLVVVSPCNILADFRILQVCLNLRVWLNHHLNRFLRNVETSPFEQWLQDVRT